MNELMNKQILHRYILNIKKDDPPSDATENSPQMEVVVSFYRGQVDPAYQVMMKDMIDAGLFDDFIAGTLQGLVHQGESALV